MPSDLFPFVAASTVSLCGVALKVIGRVIIVAMRAKPQEDDYVFTDDLALFGLLFGIACLIAYQKIPSVICPLAAEEVIGAGEVFGILLSVQAFFFFVSILLVGKIQQRDIKKFYNKTEYSETIGRRAWRVVWRNMIGIVPLLLALTLMFLRPQVF